MKELPYIVPVAIQLAIPLAKGINGEIINDFSVIGAPFHMLNLCIFPLENKSVILMSSHQAGKEYNTFETALNDLSLEKQLEVINYMVFSFSEDYYCNIDVLNKICLDEKFIEVCQCESECDLTLEKIPVIPNILTEEYTLN